MAKKIVILGAGVIGLTTALQLKKSNSEYDITVIGQHIPGDIDIEYTSPFAGANWHSFATLEDKTLQEFDKPGYFEFIRLAKFEPRSGVWLQPNVEYNNEDAAKNQDKFKYRTSPWFKDFTNFRFIEKKDLPEGMVSGSVFDGVVISTQIYLQYLVQRLLEMGVGIKRVAKLQSIQQALNHHSSGEKADLVINSSGLLSKNLSGFKDDKLVYPVRGQVLHVRNNAKTELHVGDFPGFPNESLYIMPRKEGGSIMGGCFERDLNNLQEDKELTKRIIERAKKYAPDMVNPNYKNNPTEIDIIRVNVGLRPFRDSGARVEIDPDHSEWLIHNYGAGGGGYQGSYGYANKVVQLANQLFAKKSKL